MTPGRGVVPESEHNLDIISHNAALQRSLQELRQLRRDMGKPSQSPKRQSIAYSELAMLLQDLGGLLAIAPEPSVSCSVVAIPPLLAMSINMLAMCDTGLIDIAIERVLQSVTHFCGGLFSFHCGVQQFAAALEDTQLELAWSKCFLGGLTSQHAVIPNIRRGPGVLSWAEEVQKCSRDINVSLPVYATRIDIGVATIALLDSWRISHIILKLHLGEIEQVRRQSDTISRACLDLAKLCTFETGREVKSPKLKLTIGFVCFRNRYAIAKFPHCLGKTFSVTTNLRDRSLPDHANIPYRRTISSTAVANR
jgi:hypothetical protein